MIDFAHHWLPVTLNISTHIINIRPPSLERFRFAASFASLHPSSGGWGRSLPRLSGLKYKDRCQRPASSCCGSGSESGSGSTGSTCFWASRILLSSCKNSKKNFDPTILCLFWLFIFEKWCKCTFKKWKAEIFCKKISFLFASWRSMSKIAGSGSRIRISQRHGSVRIHTKMSWIRNTASQRVHCEDTVTKIWGNIPRKETARPQSWYYVAGR